MGRAGRRGQRLPNLLPFKGEAGRGMGQEDKCIVAEMVREDLKSAERDELIKHHGYKAMDYHE